MSFALSPEDLENINLAIETVKGLKGEVKRAIQAGIDTGVSLEALDEQEKKLLAIKRTYFPTGKAGKGES